MSPTDLQEHQKIKESCSHEEVKRFVNNPSPSAAINSLLAMDTEKACALIDRANDCASPDVIWSMLSLLRRQMHQGSGEASKIVNRLRELGIKAN